MKKIINILLVLLLTISLSSITLFAQEEDPFDESGFDDEFEQEEDEAEENVLETRFGGSVSYSISNLTQAFDNYLLSSSLTGKAYFKAQYQMLGQFYISYTFNYPLFYFSDMKKVFAITSDSATYSLSEIFIDFNIEEVVYLRLGKQIVGWGSSFFWTPVDFVNTEQIDQLAEIDTRGGKNSLRVDIPLGETYFIAFFDLNFIQDEGSARNIKLYEVPMIMRFDFLLGGYNIGLSGYYKKDNPWKVGIDFSGSLFGFDIYSEAMFSPEIEKDKLTGITYLNSFPVSTTTEDISSPVIQVSFGFQKSFGETDEWGLSGEFFYNSIGYSYKDLNNINFLDIVVASGVNEDIEIKSMYMSMFYYYLSLSKSNFISNKLSTSLSAYGNLSDFSFALMWNLSVALTDTMPFSVGINLNGWGEKKEFNNLVGKDYQVQISFSLSQSF